MSLFVALGLSLQAQCVSGDCQNGDGVFIFPSGAKYIGQFRHGQITGYGSCVYSDGSRYQGEWLQGLQHGKGVKTYADGSREAGLWEKGRFLGGDVADIRTKGGREDKPTGCISGNCKNGKGLYVFPSGALYTGEFVDGEIHGYGVCYYSDGSKYQGEWRHRFPDGRGTKTYPDGSARTGLWERGQPVDETGEIVDAVVINLETQQHSNEVQSGCLFGDCGNGNGIYAYPDGSRYEGEFRNGKPHGQGMFKYPNQDRYEGAFRSGVPHGRGTLAKVDGVTVSGEWRDGEYVGRDFKSDVARTGCLEGDCINGYGTYAYKNGAKYVGNFRNKLPHGYGTVYYANGEKYVGQLSEAVFNGLGTLYRLDGSIKKGYWRNGKYLGEEDPDKKAVAQMEEPPIPTATDNFEAPAAGADIKIWAVVVGISSYSHMPALRYTDDDAYRIFAFLKSPEGGALSDEQVRILIDDDATHDKILKTLEEVFSKAGSNDMVLLYFSGHGLKGAFLPIDYDGFANAIQHEEISRILKRSPAKYKLCIADACHSGSLVAERSATVPNMILSYYQALARAGAGTALLLSSKSEETSLESSGLRQGVFSHFLIRGLKGEADRNDDQIVTVQELYEFVHTNVRNYTGFRQSPVIRGRFDEDMPVAIRRRD